MGGGPFPAPRPESVRTAPLPALPLPPWDTPATSGEEEEDEAQSEDEKERSELLQHSGKGPEKNPETRAARQALEKAVKSNEPKAIASAHSVLARRLQKEGREREALQHLYKAIRLYAEQKNARARSLDYMMVGEIFLGRAKSSVALKYLEEARKLIPKSEEDKLPKLMGMMALCHLRKNRPDHAKQLYARALSLLEKKGDEKAAASIHMILGEIEVSRSDFRSARSSFLNAEKILKKTGQREKLGLCLLSLAYVELEMGNLKESRKRLTMGENALQGQSPDHMQGLPLLIKGMDAHQRGRIIIAAKHLTSALNHYTKSGARTMEAKARLALAELEADRSRLTAALAHSGRSLKDFRILSDLRGESAALEQIGRVYYLKGYVRKAQEYAQEALAIARKIGARNRMATSRTLLARIHSSLGDVDFAWKMLREASLDCKATGNLKSGAYVNLTLAEFRIYRQASEKSVKALNKALKDFSAIGDKRGLAECEHVRGLLHELRGEGEEARKRFTKAYDSHGELWDRLGQGRDLTALGVNYKNRGNYEKALEYFDQALDLRKGVGNLKGVAANLANKGNVRRHQGKLSMALDNLKTALDIYRQLGDKKGEADLLTNLANVHAARGAYSHSMDQLSKALELHREIQDFRGMAADLAAMGKLSLARGDLESADQSLTEARRINSKIRNPRGEVAILVETALLERARKNTSNALRLLNQGLKLASSIDDSRAISSIYLKSAGVYRDKGANKRALELLGKALEMMRRHEDKLGELWALGRMGIIQGNTGDYEEALKNLNKAVKLRSKLGFSSSEGLDLDYHLGAIYEGFKDYEKALDHYQRALARAQISGGQATLGKTYDRIGNIYYRMEEYDKAKEFLEDALRIHSETGATVMRKKELIRLGDVLSKLDQPEEALKRQMKALTLTRETQDYRTEARVLTRIGTLYQLVGRPRAALQHYSQARDIRLQLGDMRGVNENYLQIALVTSILGDFKSAVEDLKKAFEIAQRSEDRSMLWKAYFVMGRALQGKGRPGEALESYRKAITVLEAMEADIIEESDEDNFIFGGKIALFETTLRVLMRLARKTPKGAYDNQALRIVEKLKAAEFENTLSRTNVESFSDVPRELIIREKSVKLALKQINSRISDELSKINQDKNLIDNLLKQRRSKEKTLNELKRQFLEEYPYYSDLRYPQPVSVNRLQRRAIHAQETVLEYMVTRSRTYIFAMDQRHFYTYSVDYPLKDIERDVNEIIRPFRSEHSQSGWDPSVAYRLYSRLIRPVEDFLKGKENLVIIPHGPLTMLPFEILVTSKKHSARRFWTVTDRPKHLVEQYAICYFPSASVLSHVRLRDDQQTPGWIMAAFGAARYDRDQADLEMNKGAERLLSAFRPVSDISRAQKMKISDLPATEKEIAEIVKIVGGPTQTYLGDNATETLFKKADLSRYAYIHLSTRGALLPSGGKLWQRPAIVFSLYGDTRNDGFLELGEIFGLKLNADMVALSSALTTEKDEVFTGKSVTALARAFIFAGANSLVTGLWQSPRDTAVTLFAEMYRNLDTGSKAKALRQAKLNVLGNKLTSHPYFWGGFMLMGDWKMSIERDFDKVDPGSVEFKGISTWQRMLSM
jgi:tetratricopeptide (TPR) repeat protein